MRHPVHHRRYGAGASSLLICVTIAGASLWAHRDACPAPGIGWGDIAIIPSDTADPSMWRLVPGIGPVLAQRLAIAGESRILRSRADLAAVEGIGPVLASRTADCIRW